MTAADELTRARDAVLEEAEAFRRELEPALASALRAGLERLTARQAAHVAGLDDVTRRALQEAIERAVGSAVATVSAKLRDPELWLSPLTAPDLLGPEQEGWSIDVPSWLAGMLRRAARPAPPRLGALDVPTNRIWIAVASAAGPVDAVLQEFGFGPGERRIGGGRFGVVPRSLPRLDPSGALQRRWRRYRAAFERYEALLRVTG